MCSAQEWLPHPLSPPQIFPLEFAPFNKFDRGKLVRSMTFKPFEIY